MMNNSVQYVRSTVAMSVLLLLCLAFVGCRSEVELQNVAKNDVSLNAVVAVEHESNGVKSSAEVQAETQDGGVVEVIEEQLSNENSSAVALELEVNSQNVTEGEGAKEEFELEEKEDADEDGHNDTGNGSVLEQKKSSKKGGEKEEQSGLSESGEESGEQGEESAEIIVALDVLSSDGKASYKVHVKAGDTVEDLMNAAVQYGLTYTSKGYGAIGEYVESINGEKEDTTAGFYWIYYVNGDKAKVGISMNTLSDGDIVEWKYEKSY